MFDPIRVPAFTPFDSLRILKGVWDMSEQVKKLHDILVLCILRFGQTQDKRFALAALVTYQSLPTVMQFEAINYVERKLREIQDRVVSTLPEQSNVSTLASLIRSTGLVEALTSEKAAKFDRLKATLSLREIAPALAKSIETYDLPAAYRFKPESALTAAA